MDMRGFRALRKGVPAILVFALLGAACSKTSSSALSGGQSPTASSSSASTGGYGTGSRYGGGGSSSTTPPVAANTVQQGAGGLVFAPTTLTVGEGTTITVMNVGSATHTFTVSNTGIDVVNAIGQSQNVTVNLKPGTYPFICRFHVGLGMKGTLVVTG
jgi:plastocyanin